MAVLISAREGSLSGLVDESTLEVASLGAGARRHQPEPDVAAEAQREPAVQPDAQPDVAAAREAAAAGDAEVTATVPPQGAVSSGEPRGNRGDMARIFARGELVGDVYEVGDVIGSGGMGQVFAAMDRSLEREVALKACWPRVERSVLRAEAKTLAALRHAGIVTVHTLGRHEGVDFLVMERLCGRTLHEHIQQRKGSVPFSVEESLDVLMHVADTIAVIHRTGFIHRDLKPANIMLTHERRPVLLDLGVSFRSDQVESENRMAGSPHYIAPEAVTASIARGQAHLIDVYALGIIAFEMLTGRRPFDDEETVNILDMHLHADPGRVSDHVAGVPVHLDRLIARMMRKRPEERPPSAMVVAARLRELRRGARHCTPRVVRALGRGERSNSRSFG